MTTHLHRAVAARPKRARCGLSVSFSRPVSNAAAHDPKENISQTVSFKDMVYGNPLRLPRLPIPSLEDTVSRYLQSVEPLVRGRSEDFAQTKAVTERFLRKDGPVLHAMVLDKDAAQKGYPHSYVEKIWDDMYLGGRWSVPINSNPYLALKPPPDHAAIAPGSDPQIVGATRFISSFLKWNRRVRDGSFEPDNPPGCLYGYALQGGTSRVARRGRDELHYHPASRHAIVFCNNRMFRLNLLGGEDGEAQISEKDLQKSFEQIRSSAMSESKGSSASGAFVGHLTAKDRDEWAASREALKGFSPINKATFFEIDSALLVIALDYEDTPDFEDEARAFLTGDGGRNRWFDKHQLVVLKNGEMAVNFEHSYSDGMIWARMLGEIWHDMYDMKTKAFRSFPKAPLLASPPPQPREVVFKIPQELERDVLSAGKEFGEACNGYTLDAVEFRDYGKNACKEWKLSPDAVAQMSFQLAFRRLHGCMPSTYESCSTRFFHRGRTETIRSCTTESADFASVMDSEASGRDTKRAALERAASKHIQVAKAAVQGQGVDRHITAMRSAAAARAGGGEEGLGAEFFNDPLTSESAGWRLSTSNVSMPFLSSFGFGATAADGYGIGYLIDQDNIIIPLTAYHGGGNTDGKLMAQEVSRALRDIGDACR